MLNLPPLKFLREIFLIFSKKFFQVSSFGFKIPTQIRPKVLAQAIDICKGKESDTRFFNLFL